LKRAALVPVDCKMLTTVPLTRAVIAVVDTAFGETVSHGPGA
jgi:hypothetical protein